MSVKASHQYFGLSAIPIRLHMRTDLHLARKLWHMLMGLAIVSIYLSGMSRSTAVFTLGCVLGLDLLMETVRLRSPAINETILRYWGPLMRTNEIGRVSGIPYYLAAAILAIGIFPKPIAVLSILYLACGDPMASLFGVLYGKRSIKFPNGKSLVGTLAGVVTCGIATYVFLSGFGLSTSSVLILTALGGISGGTAELLPLEVDDNFSIPIVSGFVLWLSFIILGL